MPPEPTPPAPPIDFSRRAAPSELPEWMDEPCTYDDFRHCLLDLRQVNRLSLGYRPTLAFLNRIADRILATTKPPSPLRIVDVGSGGGDMLRQIERWAAHRRIPVTLTGIDLNPHAARAAREFTPPDSSITWLTSNAYTYTQPIDIVLSSLFTHHLESPEIVRFLTWSESVARHGWFINDLVREPTPYHLFAFTSHILRWHRFVQHDGPVSFRRSFREPDWQRMLTEAHISLGNLHLTRWTPGRLCVGRIK